MPNGKMPAIFYFNFIFFFTHNFISLEENLRKPKRSKGKVINEKLLQNEIIKIIITNTQRWQNVCKFDI